MNRYTDFPRNTKQAHIKSCAATAREAAIRAAQMEQAYQEHTPIQNTKELLVNVWENEQIANLGIDIRKIRVAA